MKAPFTSSARRRRGPCAPGEIAARLGCRIALFLWVLLVWDGALGVASGQAQGALRWHWSNPLPHGGTIVDMAYSPSLSLGVQVAERGQIYTSGDLDLWLPRASGTTVSLRGVAFFGTSQRILITGEAGRVLYADSVDAFHEGVVDSPTSDWLEAVATSPSLAVAVGDNGCVCTTSDGVNWKRQSIGYTNWLRGAAWGDGAFVTVGTGGFVARSQNGTTWTRRASGTGQHLNRVIWARDRFHAVGNAGVSLISLDQGLTWTSEPTGATNVLENADAPVGSRLAVGVQEVRLRDMTGLWNDELAQSDGPPAWTYYACVGQIGFHLIGGRTGMLAEGYLTNGVSGFWLTPYDSIRNWLWDVTRLPGLYVTVGDFGTVMTSGNGADWILEWVPAAATNRTLLGIGGTTNLLVAVGEAGTVLLSDGGEDDGNGSQIGVMWTTIDPPTSHDLQGVAVLQGRLFVITGDNGTVLTSTNGTQWSAQATPTRNLLSSVTDWPGGLVATGDDGTVLGSADGFVWETRTSRTTNWLYRVRYVNGTLVAVGQNGTLLTSVDSTNWTARVTGTTQWLTDVAWVGGAWYVTGHRGTLLASTNLATWVAVGTLTRNALYGAATDTRQLVTVGVEGCILRSPVVPDTTPPTILSYDRVVDDGLPALNVFLFAGQLDQCFTLDRCPGVGTNAWTSSATLEITDGSGVLYYVETISGTNMPVREYYRAALVP
jgi:hypothetical protein